MVNKKDDWHRERRIGKAVKAGIKCFCGSEAYRDILEVTMNSETFPRVHRIFCPNCGLQMRSPAGNDDDFIVRQWRDISDMHLHRKEEQDRADRAVGMADLIPRAAAIEAILGSFNAIRAIEELHAMDAVPVVWLEDKELDYRTIGDKMFSDAFAVVIGEWQKEQEARQWRSLST